MSKSNAERQKEYRERRDARKVKVLQVTIPVSKEKAVKAAIAKVLEGK